MHRNVTLRRVGLSSVAVQKQLALHIVYLYFLPYLPSLQIACSILCCYLWHVCLYHIFPHYLKQRNFLEGGSGWGVIEHMKCVLISCTNYV